MSDFILFRKSRNIASSILHVILNILLGVGSIILTIITGSWLLGFLLVILSKWRMFAVRPRYWLLNLKSNLVDLIVGVSFVLIAYCSGNTEIYFVHYLLAVLYSLWLVILKPMSSPAATAAQALIAIFLGTTAATLMSASSDSLYLVFSCLVIGYSAARHVLVQSDDTDFSIVPVVCGLIAAEVAWLCHSWLIVYKFTNVPFIGNTGIIIPQLSIILTIIAFCFGIVYSSIIKHDGKIKASEVTMPFIFSLLVVIIIVIWFSKPIFDI